MIGHQPSWRLGQEEDSKNNNQDGNHHDRQGETPLEFHCGRPDTEVEPVRNRNAGVSVPFFPPKPLPALGAPRILCNDRFFVNFRVSYSISYLSHPTYLNLQILMNLAWQKPSQPPWHKKNQLSRRLRVNSA